MYKAPYTNFCVVNDCLYAHLNKEFFIAILMKDNVMSPGPLVSFTFEKIVLLPDRLELIMNYV